MRRTIALVLVAAIAVLALVGCASPSSPGGTSGGSGASSGNAAGAAAGAAVEIKEFTFQPATVEIAVGGAVTWTNADTAVHTVKGDGWGSGDLAQGATYSHSFDTAGTFAYSCGIHPTMTGEIVVK
jgi:plastocyanin